MANPAIMLPSTPRFLPKGHTRTTSRSPTRSRIMDDLLADLSPATTFEAFTSASGTLKASIEAASPTQRAFGLRAAIASKKIQEWLTELSAWQWPAESSEGFELPFGKRRTVLNNGIENKDTEMSQDLEEGGRISEKDEYLGSFSAADVRQYESRLEEISDEMEDLNVEEIKGQILNTHVLPRSRASSMSDAFAEALSSQPYTRMDDFTAVVTATVLQALPSLSRLIALMEIWSVRLSVLHKVVPLITSMNDVEVALRSGWNAIQVPELKLRSEETFLNTSTLSRQDYEIMRDVLQEKVSRLGQKIDRILDTLEGRNETLPEAWLDRMESIEQDYGEWVVCGEREVREAEWIKERAARQLEKMRRPPSPLVDPHVSDLDKRDSTLKPKVELVANGRPIVALQMMPNEHTEATTLHVAPPLDHISLEGPLREQSPIHSEPHLFDAPEERTSDQQISETMRGIGVNTVQSIDTSNVLDRNLQGARLEDFSLDPQPSSSRAMSDGTIRQGEAITDFSTISDGVFEDVNSKDEFNRSPELSYPSAETQSNTWTADEKEAEPSFVKNMPNVIPVITHQAFSNGDLLRSDEEPSILDKVSSSQHNITAPTSGPAETSKDDTVNNLPHTPLSASQVSHFEHPLISSKHEEISQEVMPSQGIIHTSDLTHSLQEPEQVSLAGPLKSPAIEMPLIQKQEVEGFRFPQHEPHEASSKPLENLADLNAQYVQHSILDFKPTHIDLPSSTLVDGPERKKNDHLSPEINSPDSTKGHTRGPSSASVISGYATSEPSPVLHEAEPTEYFRPVSPPIIAKLPDLSSITTPKRSSFNITPVSAKGPDGGFSWEPEALNSSGFSQGSPKSQRISYESRKEEHLIKLDSVSTSAGTPPRRRPASNDSVISVIRSALGQGRTSQEGSISSDVSTINERLNSVTSTPVRVESPAVETVPRSWHSQFVSNYDGDSPSPDRVGLTNNISNYSPASSPPPESPSSERRPMQLRRTASFDPDSFYPDSPATPTAPPALSDLELSPTPALSIPSKYSDDQLQQQISEILESIPARITLTSEPETTTVSEVKPAKKRISLNPFSRPASRAATPSFTLAPAYARNPRPRPQNGNPEIKLYHLSRSTGEAPIKLFVRLVGEHGERVMVRVGGGWADLGEYLKEYASHHGRRAERSSNVEIQDLPPRVVSTGSTASVSTLKKGTWNTSEASSPISRPSSRPSSALGRPLSSLAIRKTRKSINEDAREKAYRSPSTPLPPSFRSSPTIMRQGETPPSANSVRSVSQMGWREEESSLGLAGPRSRKGEISAENAAWVESMKEKVRVASAEKEKKDKAAFGNMGQVGTTKRLFKKN